MNCPVCSVDGIPGAGGCWPAWGLERMVLLLLLGGIGARGLISSLIPAGGAWRFVEGAGAGSVPDTSARATAPGLPGLSSDRPWFQGGLWSSGDSPAGLRPDLIINEFVAENASGLRDESGDCEDWIELHNRGDAPVSLEGWSLSDDAGRPDRWVFPAVIVPAKGFLVVFASGKDRRSVSANARLHTNFKLGIAGEYLGLYSPGSPRVAVSELAPSFPEQRQDVAYGRDPLDGWHYFTTPTPGAANASTWTSAVVEPVHFSVPRGFFAKPFNLSLATPTPGAQVRYTLDGSVPTLANGILYTNQLALSATRVVRAAAFRSDSLPSRVTTHTYLFNQPSLRRTLPALSLVTASNHLYGRTGIMEYSPRNTLNHGIAWERPVSAEWIRPGDNGGFQVDCGIRIQGGGYIRSLYNYRSGSIPESKYSFRLYFRGDYGEGRLRQPIFPEVPVDSFDTLVLRAGMNDATNPFLRDEFARRLEADVGQVSARGTFVHLFLNGVYKGYYNPTERIDADFLRAWHGGTNDWDIIAMGGEIREGDAVAWNALRSYASGNNLALPDKYLQIERRLDTTNFVEYLIPLIYADTDDWPHNNWRAARERSTRGRFRFYAWDAEWSFGYSHAASHNTIAGQLSNLSPPWGGSEIQSLFLRLKASPEFRLLFADRVHQHFFNDGAMTDPRLKARYEWLKAQIAPAISGFDNSIGTSWIPSRRRHLTNHFAQAGLLASSNAPVMSRFGGRVPRGFPLSFSSGLGTVYYTTNGTDPRVRFTGAVAPDAFADAPGTPLIIDHSLVVRARTHWSTNWSALTQAAFEVGDFGLPLCIAEIMYHPPGGEADEFIELANLSAVPIDLSGVTFEGVTYQFPHGTVLAGGARLVLISDDNPDAFARRHPGVTVFGCYQGSLSNGGERLALLDAAQRTIVSVDYRDDDGWPAEADGDGSSLEIVDPAGDPDNPANWRASARPGGSPGAPNPADPLPAVRLNEVAATPVSDLLTNDWCELFNAGPVDLDLTGWSLHDGSPDRCFRFPPTLVPAGQFLVVFCDGRSDPPGLHSGFGLDRQGDQLFLADASGQRIDALQFGPQAAGFTLGRFGSDQAWQLNKPTPGTPNALAVLGAPARLVINEFLANAPPGDDDWIELHNGDPQLPVALRGLSLGISDALYTVRSLSFIGPGGYVLLRADQGPGPDHVDFRLPAARGVLALADAAGHVVDQVSYTNALEGVSLGRWPDGNSNLVAFAFSASPGTTNDLATYRGVQLNEILARHEADDPDGSGRSADWIELSNPTAEPVLLAGMSLSVGERQPGQWTFPAGTQLGPGDHLVVWCDAARPPSTEPGAHLDCGLDLADRGGDVCLYSGSGQIVDAVEYGFQLPDRSVGRSVGDWMLLDHPTPGASNAAPAELGNPLRVRLNEWLANTDSDDWIELYNPDSLPVTLSRMVLTDDPSLAGQTNHVIGPLTFIGAGGWVVWTARDDVTAGPEHLPFRLDSLGETVRLYTASQIIVDSVDLRVQAPGVSEGRFPDGGTDLLRFPGTASPGQPNYLALDAVVISEVLADSRPPFEAAIEFHNLDPQPVDLGGWWLSHEGSPWNQFRIPTGTSVPARGYRVLYQKDLGPQPGSPEGFVFRTGLAGVVVLSQADAGGRPTGYRSVFRYGVAEPNTAFGRIETSLGADFAPLRRPSFGVDHPADVASFRAGQGAPNAPPRLGPVILSEIMFDPVRRTPAGIVEHPEAEYLELHNPTAAEARLGNPDPAGLSWRLSGGVEFEFPPDTTLSAGAYLLVVGFNPATDTAALQAFRDFYGLAADVRLLGPFRGRLANEGERLRLECPLPPLPPEASQPGLVPFAAVEAITYGPNLPWPPAARATGRSLQRNTPWAYANEPMNWHAGWPTPGRDNLDVEPDADQDALPDEWELLHGLNPWLASGADGPNGDPDNDGLPNDLEFGLDTDPRSKEIVVTGLTATCEEVVITLNAIAGHGYALEESEHCEAAEWRLRTTIPPATTSGLIEVRLPATAPPLARFFRVRLR